MFERSHALRPNVDAYKTNIEGFGHRLVETIDLDAPDVDEKVRDSIRLELAFDDKKPVVTDVMVSARIAEIRSSRMLERLQLELFFDGLSNGEITFTELRERTRMDLEVTGNAYWEVVRNQAGNVAQLNYAAATVTRLMPTDARPIKVETKRKVSAVSFRPVVCWRRFRRFVQQLEGQDVIYFKEYGDPRVMGALTGRFYTSEKEGQEKEGDRWLMATEMIHFKIHSPLGPYGVPRWIGATPAVLGTRASEEVNYIYFENKAVPPLAITVSGGALAKGATQRIKNYIRDNIKGRQNFHSVLVLEAESEPMSAGAQPPRVRIELHPLMMAQQQDALFQKYDAQNTKKIGGMFRLPKLLRGDTDDFNRATADAALRYAETQLFEPERQKVDHVINQRLLSDIDIRFWRFQSGSPIAKDPAEQSTMLRDLEKYITPEEARKLIGPLFGTELRDLDAEWTKQPVSVMIARLQAGLPASEDQPDENAPDTVTQSLVNLRSALEREADEDAQAETDAMQKVESLQVSATEFNSWLEPQHRAYPKRPSSARARRRRRKKENAQETSKPFAGFDDFDDCLSEQRAKGHDEDSARAICGKLQAETE
jgi:PBSX family phage portal protein